MSFLHDIKERSRQIENRHTKGGSSAACHHEARVQPSILDEEGRQVTEGPDLLHSLFRLAHVHLWPCSHVPETT